MKKSILFIFFCILTGNLNAQLSQVKIGVDGFTCSLCAKGVEAQFKALDFVRNVKTDLKRTEFTLSFKPDMKIDISKIKSAVSDGGFTVRDIEIKAEGNLVGDQNSGYFLVTKNAPDIALTNVNEKIDEEAKIMIEGKVNLSNNKVKVSSIRKL